MKIPKQQLHSWSKTQVTSFIGPSRMNSIKNSVNCLTSFRKDSTLSRKVSLTTDSTSVFDIPLIYNLFYSASYVKRKSHALSPETLYSIILKPDITIDFLKKTERWLNYSAWTGKITSTKGIINSVEKSVTKANDWRGKQD